MILEEYAGCSLLLCALLNDNNPSPVGTIIENASSKQC
jgi:hypothetical protein